MNNPEQDKKAEALINGFMQALLSGDAGAAAQSVLPFVHKSLLNNSGNSLTQDLLNFSFKKAHSNAKFYAHPVVISRVAENKSTGIGFGPTAELGTEFKYWIDKKPGVNGMPAPLNVFFPADGGDPKICYMGSL